MIILKKQVGRLIFDCKKGKSNIFRMLYLFFVPCVDDRGVNALTYDKFF